MTFYQEIASKNPTLKRRLVVAHIERTPEEYVKKNVIAAATVTAGIGFGLALLFTGFGIPLLVIVPVAVIVYMLIFKLFMNTVEIQIRKYAREIDRDVLFAGRFLLIKLNSGKPLVNAIIDASNSYGVANKYFKEIVRDIELGTPLEEALDKASRYSPSEKMRKIVFQISNALKIGIDVTNFLEAILDDIAEEQLTEIKGYGKKLSSITLLYMLFAIVIPSLGITMFITVVSLVNIPVDFGIFFIFLFLLVIIEFIFMTVFRSIRPNVNI